MKTRLILLIIPFYGILFSSCEKYKCIEGTGRVSVSERDLLSTPFTGIISKGDFDIYLYEDTVTPYFVTIETDENIRPYIVTEVTGNDLIIETINDKCLQTDFPIRINVYLPYIEYIAMEGDGNIFCDYIYSDLLIVDLPGSGFIQLYGLDAGMVEASITGSGKLELGGFAYDTRFLNSGSGQLVSDLLRSNNCTINISGSGDMFVWAMDLITGKMSGSGNLYYKVWPYKGINVELSGTGDIFPLY